MKALFQKLRNRYFLSLVAIALWLVFFDKNDVFTQYELIEKCHKLEMEKEYYLKEIGNNKTGLEELRQNEATLETLAREKYLMKKDNEDVFVFVTN